jgi:sugar phosphate isomerase/epimerase
MKQRTSRRNFFRSAALLAAGSTMANRQLFGNHARMTRRKPASANLPGKAPLKIGIMTYNIARNWDIETIIKHCSEAGFQHAELRTTHAHGVEITLSKAQRKEVRKRFEDSPLEAISLASAFAYHWPDQAKLRQQIEGTKEYLQLAADVGALGVRVFPNALVEGVDPEITLEQIGKSLAEVGKSGHDLGVDVRVCVHGQGTDTPPMIKKILDYSQSPHVYVNWNCGMPDVTDGKGFEPNFNLLKDRIRGVHMHALYEQEYPYRFLFSLLNDSGYTGYLNAEIPESPEPVRLMKYYRALFLALQDAV